MGLDIYIPEPREVMAGGKAVAVTPLRVRQISAFVRHISAPAPMLLSGRLQDALASHGDDLAKAMAVATDLTEAEVGELYPDEFVALVAAVMEVNADFFGQRVAPRLAALQQATEMKLKATAGATSSPLSSGTATG